MDGLCSPKFPTCSQTAIFFKMKKKRDFMVHHLGGLFSKNTFY